MGLLCVGVSLVAATLCRPTRAAGRPSTPPDVYGAELPADRVLPAAGVDLPIGGFVAGPDRVVSLAPSVQAIPTPTAFEVGAVTLAFGVAVRLGRRRSAKSA